MHTATAVGSETYRYLEPYTMVGLIFLAISLPTAFGLRRFEAWARQTLASFLDDGQVPCRCDDAMKTVIRSRHHSTQAGIS